MTTPIDIDLIANTLTRIVGFAVAPGDVALALMNISVDDIYDKYSKSISWEIWDKESDINGTPASRILSRRDMGAGEVYLIRVDGNVVIVQPHPPQSVESMTVEQAGQAAEAQIAQMISDQVTSELITAITPMLNPPVEDPLTQRIQEVFDAAEATKGNRRRRYGRE